MADFSVGRISRRGFGRLFSAYGRDSRMDFWIFVALVFGTLNVIGGFLVTDRMLGMFKGKKKELPAAQARASGSRRARR
mgnify:CR=1 FL=1